jgi:hypothetical protein
MNHKDQIEGKEALEIVSVFGKIILEYPNRSNPISKLPFTKEKIKEAFRIIFLISEINYQQGKDSKEYYDEMKTILKDLYIHLATFIADREAEIMYDLKKNLMLRKNKRNDSTEIIASLTVDNRMYDLSLLVDKKIESDIQILKIEVEDLLEKIEADVKASLYSKAN